MIAFLTEMVWVAVIFLYGFSIPLLILKGIYEFARRMQFVSAFSLSSFPYGFKVRSMKPGYGRSNGYEIQAVEKGYLCVAHVNGWRLETYNPNDIKDLLFGLSLRDIQLSPLEGSLTADECGPVKKMVWDTPVRRPFYIATILLVVMLVVGVCMMLLSVIWSVNSHVNTIL